MGLSRGASALGVALAFGEIEPAALDDAAIGKTSAYGRGGPAARPASS